MKAKTRSDTGLPTVIGIDIGKEVFHLVGLGADGRIALRRKIKRKRLGLKDAFERLPPRIVGMEACLSAHFVSRTLRALGHEPRIHSGDLPQALREGPEERLQRCRDHRRSGVASEPLERARSRANLRSPSRSAVVGYAVSVKGRTH